MPPWRDPRVSAQTTAKIFQFEELIDDVLEAALHDSRFGGCRGPISFDILDCVGSVGRRPVPNSRSAALGIVVFDHSADDGVGSAEAMEARPQLH